MGTFVFTSPITIAARLSVMFTAVVVPVRLSAQEKTNGTATRGAQAGASVGMTGQGLGSANFFSDVHQGLGAFIDEAGKREIQATAGILDSILPPKPPVQPSRITADQRKAFEGAAGALDEFLSGWRQSGSLTSEQQRAIEDAVKALNEMSSVPMSESVARAEQSSALMPEPTPPRPPTDKRRGTASVESLHIIPPPGWTQKDSLGGISFLWGPPVPYDGARGSLIVHYASAKMSMEELFAIHQKGMAHARSKSGEHASSMLGPKKATIGKENYPAVWTSTAIPGATYRPETYYVPMPDGVYTVGIHYRADSREAFQRVLKTIEFTDETSQEHATPVQPDDLTGPSSNFLKEQAENFFNRLSHVASENNDVSLALYSEMMELYTQFPTLRDSVLEAWEKVSLKLQDGRIEQAGETLRQASQGIVDAMKSGALQLRPWEDSIIRRSASEGLFTSYAEGSVVTPIRDVPPISTALLNTRWAVEFSGDSKYPDILIDTVWMNRNPGALYNAVNEIKDLRTKGIRLSSHTAHHYLEIMEKYYRKFPDGAPAQKR